MMPAQAALPEPFAGWFARRGWTPHPHQLALLDRTADPSTLLVAPTGGGKTLAGFLPSLVELGPAPPPGLHTLYVSPLKALAADIGRNLRAPLAEMALADPRRGPHRRHQARHPRPPARRPAAPPAHHPRIPRPDALLRAGAGDLRRPLPHHRRRDPRPRREQARRPARALPRPPADPRARPPPRRPLRHRRGPAGARRLPRRRHPRPRSRPRPRPRHRHPRNRDAAALGRPDRHLRRPPR